MLSSDLAAMADNFAAWAALPVGVALDARMCGIIARTLAEATDRARELERQPVPPRFGGALPAGVVNLDIERDARRAGAA